MIKLLRNILNTKHTTPLPWEGLGVGSPLSWVGSLGSLGLLLILLVSCSSDGASDSPSSPSTPTTSATPIEFAAPSLMPTTAIGTRAAFGTIDDLPDRGPEAVPLRETSGFGVFGCYTGLHRYADSNVQPDFMYNEHLTWSDALEHWTYSPVKYWPNGEGETQDGLVTGQFPHYVSFFAYAPYSTAQMNGDPLTTPAQDYCIYSFSYQQELHNPWLTYRLIPQSRLHEQVDLLAAIPLLDQQKPTQPNTRLQFYMQHALANVADKVSVRCNDVMKQSLYERLGTTVKRMVVVLTNLTFEYEFTDHARLNLWHNGEIKWEPILSGDWTTFRVQNYETFDDLPKVIYDTQGTTPENPIVADLMYENNSGGVFYIPVEVGHHAQTARITVEYEVRCYTELDDPATEDVDESEFVIEQSRSLSKSLYLHDYPDAYQPGKCLNFNLIIEQNLLTFTAAVRDWEGVHGSLPVISE